MSTNIDNISFSLFTGGLLAFLGVDRFKHLGHQFYFGARNNGKHIPVKMDRTALVFGVRKYFSHGFQHSQALVADDKFHAIQSDRKSTRLNSSHPSRSRMPSSA